MLYHTRKSQQISFVNSMYNF